MEYNPVLSGNYYPVQPGQPPPPSGMMNSLPDHPPMGGHIMTSVGPPMMQPSPTPSTPQSMRQTPGPPPMPMQQHMGPGPQMHPHQQPSPHPNYHQLPQHPPISHSASPHPSSTPHSQQPPPRPSTGPSPLHHQSPIHMNGPSPKLISATPLGPPSQPQTPGVGGPTMHAHHLPGPTSMNHHPHPPQAQSYVNSTMPHHSSPHYGHSPMPPHHQGPPQPHPPPPMHHHSGPPPTQLGPPSQHPASMGGGRGPPPPGSMPLHPPPPGYMTSPHGPPPMHHHQHTVNGPPPPQAVERGSPYQHIPQTEFRIIELNKRLQKRPIMHRPSGTLPILDFDESAWWKNFACDFFDDQATLSLRIPGEDKPAEYTIGRTLIPRFFKSFFDGGVTDFAIKLRNIRETTHHPGFITLDCDQTDITTKNVFRHHAQNSQLSVLVHTEGHLSIEFVCNSFDTLLIKSWRFYANHCNEYVDRSMTTVGMANPYLVEPVTRFGLTKNTFAFLKMCMIMEPMQDLMLQHKSSNGNLDPRACLKRLLIDRYNHRPVDDFRTQTGKRKRQRKEKNANGGTATGTNRRNKANSNGPNAIVGNPIGIGSNIMQPGDVGPGLPSLPLASQDVLVVGEPSMLGADFGDENERRITRLENNQFDPSTSDNAIGDNPTHLMGQQIPEETNIAHQVDGNHLARINHINQSPSQQQQQQQQQQQHQLHHLHHQQQQQPPVSSNDNQNHGIPEQQHQQNNIQPDNNSYHEPNPEDNLGTMIDYHSSEQNESMMTNQFENNEVKRDINDQNLENSNNSKDISPPSNIGNNNNNNQIISFLPNGNEGHIVKPEVDLKQHSQQQQQSMKTSVTETEAG